jgi:hypothetical protein
MASEERKKRWKIVKRRLDQALRDEEYQNITELAYAIGLPQPTVRHWFVGDTIPLLNKIMVVEKFFGLQPDKEDRVHNIAKLMGPTTRQSPETVERRAELIAEHLEIAVSLMRWFVMEATEDQRDKLRDILGTDLSYEAFNITRILLTEAHFDKLVKGEK